MQSFHCLLPFELWPSVPFFCFVFTFFVCVLLGFLLWRVCVCVFFGSLGRGTFGSLTLDGSRALCKVSPAFCHLSYGLAYLSFVLFLPFLLMFSCIFFYGVCVCVCFFFGSFGGLHFAKGLPFELRPCVPSFCFVFTFLASVHLRFLLWCICVFFFRSFWRGDIWVSDPGEG